MGIGLSGLVSGMDTDSIVKAMISGQTTKKQNLEGKMTINKWTTTAWSDLNKKIYSFYTDFASKLRLKSSYQTRSASSSDESAVKVSANINSAIGSHKVKIIGLASSQYVTGAKLEGSYKADTKIGTIDASLIGKTITIKNKVGTDDESETAIEITGKMTIAELTNALKGSGINASYDVNQKRFFLSSGDSGTENMFTLTATEDTAEYAAVKSAYLSKISRGDLGVDEQTLYDLHMKTLADADEDTIKEVLDPSFDIDADGVTSEQQSIYDAIVGLKELAAYGIEDEAEAETAKTEFMTAISDYYNFEGTKGQSTSIAALGLQDITGEAIDETEPGSIVVKAAANAELILDGATMTNNTNTVVANGITFNLEKTTLNAETNNYDEITVTVNKDTTSSYQLIKDALKSYNELIDEMSKLYYADSARKFKPLTEEQKEAMTEDEIKNWEDKIKSALLRRDSTLGGIMSGMRTALQSTYTDSEGNTFSLASYGIVTGNYTERGKLHIYGDTDDNLYAANTDRLQKALDEDPDKVMEALSSIFSNLYSTLSDKCAKTELSSALTFYNDKEYTKFLGQYEKQMKTLEDRITDLENKYYKQFTAMETALQNLQSQTNSLTSLFGMNNGNK